MVAFRADFAAFRTSPAVSNRRESPAKANPCRGWCGQVWNGLYWVLDIAFREDESRARSRASAANLVVRWHIAVNLLKQEQTAKIGIKNKRPKADWDEQYLLKVIAG